jgi:hypothetical protein
MEDPGAVQGFERWDAQPAVGGAGRKDHRSGADPPVVGEGHDQPVADPTEVGHAMHEGEVRPEDPGLLVGLLSEPSPADAAREAQVVADQRTRGGLSTDPALVHHQGVQTFGRAIDGCRKACRSGTDDDHIEVVPPRVDRGAGGVCDLPVRWVVQDLTVGKDHQRELRPGARLGKYDAPSLDPLR